MWGEFSAVGYAEVVLTVLDGNSEIVMLGFVELVAEVVEATTELEVGLFVVDVEVGLGDDVVVGAAAVDVDEEELVVLEDPDAPDPELEFPASKTTTLAVSPSGTVTTQKLAPPAPVDWSELVTPPTPLTDGSMEQGVPLQPDPEHTILMPKVGGVLESEQPVQIGFHPIFKNVFPLESVLAPAT